MTQAEYKEMYEALHFGHEIEMIWNGVRYYLEQGDNEIQLWIIEGKAGKLLSTVHAETRVEPVGNFIEEKLFNGHSVNEIVSEVTITDID